MSSDSTRPAGANATGLPLADDLMRGAATVAVFMFGETDDPKQAEANQRKIYHLSDTTDFPTFKLGGVLCGRKSTILAWIDQQERAA